MIAGYIRLVGPAAVQVILRLNGRDVVKTWSTVNVAEPGQQAFRFNLKGLWSYVRDHDVLTVASGGQEVTVATDGLRKPKAFDPDVLFRKLAAGHIFNQLGVLQLSKMHDIGWQKDTLNFYDTLRNVFKSKLDYELTACYGTMLGAVRSESFIGHDHDFDSCYISRETTHQGVRYELRQIGLALVHLGFQVVARKSCLWVYQRPKPINRLVSKFLGVRKKIKIDIFHLYFDADGVLQFPFGTVGAGNFLQSDFTGYGDAKITPDRSVRVIEDRKKFAEQIYGPGWVNPNPGFNWARDRTKNVPKAMLTTVEQSEVYWSNFYASKEFAPGSTFCAFILKSDYACKSVVDIGCGDGRDTFAFAQAGVNALGLDRSEEAVERATVRAAQNGLAGKIRFAVCDVSQSQMLDENFAKAVKDTAVGAPLMYYARFFLHSITAAMETTLLTAIAATARSGDILALEFRTSEDELEKKVHGAHFRRFLVVPNLMASLESKFGFAIRYHFEGKGLSPYKDEDPHLCRIIAQKM